jgi:hypothetical protein
MKPTRLTISAGEPAAQGGQNSQWPSSALSGGAGQIGAGGSPLPDQVRTSLESLLNADFSDVKILNNSCLPRNIGARAFTSGSDIHFASGAYQPHTPAGQKLLAYELTHVVQQKEGRTGAE